MTETTYENLTRRIDRISAEMREISEENGLRILSLLESQTKSIKDDLSRLLWIELPELNESHKIEAVSKSTTGMFFAPGIFEMDTMRKAFFKRQAKHFLRTKQSNRRI
ncbi:phage protein [Streptococcus pneumoniae]|nr:phage protein [Streptococcus pneumoniae]